VGPGFRGCPTVIVLLKIASISSLFSIGDFAKNQPWDSLFSPERQTSAAGLSLFEVFNFGDEASTYALNSNIFQSGAARWCGLPIAQVSELKHR
jgi:hypothetical protein